MSRFFFAETIGVLSHFKAILGRLYVLIFAETIGVLSYLKAIQGPASLFKMTSICAEITIDFRNFLSSSWILPDALQKSVFFSDFTKAISIFLPNEEDDRTESIQNLSKSIKIYQNLSKSI